MNRSTLLAAGLALVVAVPFPLSAAEEVEADVNFIDLATVLVRDKKYDRASNVLAQVDLEAEDVDLGRFHFLRGLVRLNLSLFSQAAEDFELAITNQQEAAAEMDDDEVTFDPRWYVYLAQAYFYSNQPEQSLESFALAGEAADEIQSTFAMRGEAYKKLERYEEAWEILSRGMKRYPDYHELLRRLVFLAIDRSLYQTAAQLGREYLDRTKAAAEDYLAIGTALYRSGSKSEALSFLELAKLRFGDNKSVITELAKIYKERSMYRTAGQLLERAAIQGDEDLAIEAAELYRQARDYYRALALNARVSDSKKRLRQRLGILLELRRYEQVAAMERDLRRVGLLDDEPLRYALAYAHFKNGDYDSADRLLSGLTDSTIFRQATELRKAMEDCRGARWRC